MTDKGPQYVKVRPILLKAWLEWFRASSITPFIKVIYDKEVMPPEWEKKVHKDVVVFSIDDGRAVNINIDDEGLSFTGKYKGKPKSYFVPLDSIVSLLNYDYKMELLIGEHLELYNSFESMKKLRDETVRKNTKPKLRVVK